MKGQCPIVIAITFIRVRMELHETFPSIHSVDVRFGCIHSLASRADRYVILDHGQPIAMQVKKRFSLQINNIRILKQSRD